MSTDDSTTHDRTTSDTAPSSETPIFDGAAGRRGLAMNKLFMSLVSPDNRARFLADEPTYCGQFRLTPDQQRAVVERDWQAMIDLGASIFYIYKLAMLDGHSMQYLGGIFTGMGEAEFLAAMQAGGRRNG